VIIGTAFGKIVSSLVEDMMMPALGALIGGLDFKNLYLQIGAAKIAYGKFIQTCVDFCIIALAIFFMVKLINYYVATKRNSRPPRRRRARKSCWKRSATC